MNHKIVNRKNVFYVRYRERERESERLDDLNMVSIIKLKNNQQPLKLNAHCRRNICD